MVVIVGVINAVLGPVNLHVFDQERRHLRRIHESTRRDVDGCSGQTQGLGQSGSRDISALRGLTELILRDSRFCIGPGLVGAWPQLITDQRAYGIPEYLQSIDVGLRGTDHLVGCQHRHEGVDGSGGNIEFAQRGLRLRERALRARRIDGGFPLPKVNRVPGELHTRSATPYAVERARTENRAGDRRDDRLREHETENVVAGGPILLPDEVQPRQIGCSSHANSGIRRIRTRATLHNPRVIPERKLDRVVERQWSGGRRLSGCVPGTEH